MQRRFTRLGKHAWRLIICLREKLRAVGAHFAAHLIEMTARTIRKRSIQNTDRSPIQKVIWSRIVPFTSFAISRVFLRYSWVYIKCPVPDWSRLKTCEKGITQSNAARRQIKFMHVAHDWILLTIGGWTCLVDSAVYVALASWTRRIRRQATYLLLKNISYFEQ